MNRRRRWWSGAAIVAALAFIMQATLAGQAQQAPAPQDLQALPDPQAADQDPPTRVARLNYREGSVSFQPGGENEWVDAVLNRPLTMGDNLWVDANSRAELHIGSTALRLGPQTAITLLEVSDRATQVRLAQGSLVVRVRRVDDVDSYEIDTPNTAFVVMQPGDYRLDVDPDGGRTDVTVWRGRGEATAGGFTYSVVAGQYATFTGSDQLDYDSGQPPASDAFDNWASNRDQAEEDSDAANYVSREMTGYEDLDVYGDWIYVAGYGPCWRPRGLAVGWAPYHFGQWAWVGPWGWTWVDGEPWGFAPFHYGRWAFAGNGWVWVPGPNVARPVYAPALVGWVGGGVGSNFSFGAGVGWFPLAPGEVFVPGYHVSRAYVNRVNVTNTSVNVTTVTTVYNNVVSNRNLSAIIYANRGVTGGVTVVSRDTFVNARPVAQNVVSVPARELAAAPVSHVAAVEPVRASVMGAGKPAANSPPTAVTNRAVVALRALAPMPRPFDQTQPGHLNNSLSTRQSLVRQQPPGRPVPTANPAARQPQDANGFRPVSASSNAGNQSKAPRVWEAEGTPEPEKPRRPERQNSGAQPSRNSRPIQQSQQSSQQASGKTAAPGGRRDEQPHNDLEQKSSNGQQQKAASAAAKPAQHSSTTASKPSSSSAKK